MASQGTCKAVLLDGMGTLIRLLPPWPALSQEAFRAEADYYVRHHLEARDAAGLADLRRRCAAVAGVSVDELMAAIRFEAFEDAAPALRELRERGLRLVVVSNWDCSLRDVLDRIGLLELLDDALASAVVGAAKPDARIFDAALAAAGCHAQEALHVGDSREADYDGARAAGLQAVLLDRSGDGGDGSLRSLAELPPLLSSLA